MQADRRRSLDANASGDRPGQSDRHGRATRGVDRHRDRTDDDAATTSRDRRRRDDEVATTTIDGGRSANRHRRSMRAERARRPIAMHRNQNRSAQHWPIPTRLQLRAMLRHPPIEELLS